MGRGWGEVVGSEVTQGQVGLEPETDWTAARSQGPNSILGTDGQAPGWRPCFPGPGQVGLGTGSGGAWRNPREARLQEEFKKAAPRAHVQACWCGCLSMASSAPFTPEGRAGG